MRKIRVGTNDPDIQMLVESDDVDKAIEGTLGTNDPDVQILEKLNDVDKEDDIYRNTVEAAAEAAVVTTFLLDPNNPYDPNNPDDPNNPLYPDISDGFGDDFGSGIF